MDTNIKNKKPLVSVIMAAYNAEKYIGEAIESILSQTYSNWELIIADDASTDTTADIINSYAKQENRIKTIRLDKNSGQTIARIKAINISRGVYLAILDADDISLPNRLSVQVFFLETHLDVVVVGSTVELINESGEYINKKRKAENITEIAFKLLLQTQFIHSSVCMRKKMYHDIGGYDKVTYKIYAEEYDLWNRFADEGYNLVNLPEILVKYRIHPQGISQSDFSGVRSKLAIDVSDKYTNFYLNISRKNIKLMVYMVNDDKRLSLIDKAVALYWYRSLSHSYCIKKNLPSDKKNSVKKIPQ